MVLIAHFEHINELETIWKIGTGFKLTLRAPEPHQPCHSILVFLSLDLNIFKVHLAISHLKFSILEAYSEPCQMSKIEFLE